MAQRKRRSLQELVECGDKLELDKVVRAFHGLAQLPPDNPDSFYSIASLHGQPFRGPGVTDGSWWGGYCPHSNVLFPTWHRAYLLRMENAMRTIEGCEDVTLPFWDQCLGIPSSPTPDPPKPIPSILTDRKYVLDGKTIDNPLFSYKLQRAIVNRVKGANARYSKHKGYETVRYPRSGLVGTEQDRMFTNFHNGAHSNVQDNEDTLNRNVAEWLQGTVKIPVDPADTPRPDTYSVESRYKTCLEAPNYTVFSNTASQNQWIKDYPPDPDGYKRGYVVSLENPHNAIHLAVGGFWQEGVYNASPIRGANGDMAINEMASFDPIFYFHHCFVDYVFWTWQKKHGLTAAGSLNVIDDYVGTVVTEGWAGVPLGSILDMQTPLYPFRKSSTEHYVSNDMVDIINQLGYDYGVGSLDPLIPHPAKGIFGDPDTAKVEYMVRVHGINRAEYEGSFVIRTFAVTPSGAKVEIGHEAVLSRWDITACANCQNNLDVETVVPVDEVMLKALGEEKLKGSKVTYHAEIQTQFSGVTPGPDRDRSLAPEVGRRPGFGGGPLIDYL